MRQVVRRPAVREFALVATLYLLYDSSRLVTEHDPGEAVRNAHALLGAERAAGLAPEHWLNHLVSGWTALAVPADYAYATLHYLVTPAVLIWLWTRHRSAYLPARRVLMVATILGVVGFALFPVAPPRLLGGFVDTMARFSGDGWWSTAGSAPRGFGQLTNQYAAMPSLHVGWALWCAMAVWRNTGRRWLRGLAAGYPILTVLVVVGTGNHYLADAVAGAAAVGLATLLVTRGPQLARAVLRALATAPSATPGAALLIIVPGRPAVIELPVQSSGSRWSGNTAEQVAAIAASTGSPGSPPSQGT